MDLFVARQPIFDGKMNVIAYEMLYRSSQVNAFDGANEDAATSKVINALWRTLSQATNSLFCGCFRRYTAPN